VPSADDGQGGPPRGPFAARSWEAFDGSRTGGSGDDNLYGSATNDLIKGAGGNDWLYGCEGSDKLYGMDGDDYLDGGPGGDEMYGGKDNDRYIVSDAGEKVIEYDQEGNDYVYSYVDYTPAGQCRAAAACRHGAQ
jgi:Ca2+-binding RTX toxin-like protein